jgi:hypothetical protein
MRSLLPLVPPVAGFCANVLSQVLLVRIFPRGGLLRSVVAGCLAGMTILLAAEWWRWGDGPGGSGESAALAAANLLIYGAASYCYFHVVNLGETARRIRILREIRLAGGALTLDAIRRRYGASEMLDRRIGRLVGTGQLTARDGRLFGGKPLMRVFSILLVAAKFAFLGKGSEFDQ